MPPPSTPPIPRWTRAGTLLLAIAPAALPLPVAVMRLDGIEFRRKRELHATIAGNALGARVRRAMADGAVRRAIGEAIDSLDWRWQRCREWMLLEKREGARCRHSLIERIELPAMAAFHRRLGELLGEALPTPPPHVTLYTAGGARGIGIADEATLAHLRVRAVDASELCDAVP
jgi:hypothetical protein